jgi:hypothetical protein
MLVHAVLYEPEKIRGNQNIFPILIEVFFGTREIHGRNVQFPWKSHEILAFQTVAYNSSSALTNADTRAAMEQEPLVSSNGARSYSKHLSHYSKHFTTL